MQRTSIRNWRAEVAMNTSVVPAWVHDLKSFRRWVHSNEFPETGRIWYLHGEVWVDLSKEEFYSHNQVKNEFNFVVGGTIRAGRLGRYVPDGMLLTNEEADLTSQPDGAFLSRRSLRTGRVRVVEGAQEGFVELEGTPDMVLEIISRSSVTKDTVTLLDLYWQAGIKEYWLVDVRGERLEFTIYRHTRKGYVATPKRGDWVKSAVFNKSFRLTRRTDGLGQPEHVLEVR
jgi:Uma2 family endonuclease